ncbi:hypothetical protein ACIA8K_33075 [Catenuloplanes sp. NPDC051500]|uniref:hypothetical protein n=1 Tax=Catenuloplanes sp. NPDC051500 TaxID=3363959 RepID=UPI00378E7C19
MSSVVRLRSLVPLTEVELGRLLVGLPAEVVHAIWLATGGWPEAAIDLATGAASAGSAEDETVDAVARLALRVPARGEFLVPDVAVIRLLETVAAQPLPGAVRARVLIRLARELLGDPSAVGRRHALVAESVELARAADEAGVLAEVLDGRLHALWDPAAALDRWETAAEIVELARRAGDASLELRGLFWRFTALAELGDLDAAEAALVTYARTAELAGEVSAPVMVLARQAVFALVRGRFELARTLADEVTAAGRRAGLADTERLSAMLTGMLAMLHGDANAQVAPLRELALRMPGHFFEATAARALAEAGRDDEALLELDRLLPAVLAGSGPRWLGAVADLAFVATAVDSPRPAAMSNSAPPRAASDNPRPEATGNGVRREAVRRLYEALLPYQGRLVVWGGANMITGPVDELLGRLARRLGQAEEALAHLDRASQQAERLGALPWLAAVLAARQRPGDRERSHDIASRLGIRVGRVGTVRSRSGAESQATGPGPQGPGADQQGVDWQGVDRRGLDDERRGADDAALHPDSPLRGAAGALLGVPTRDLALDPAGVEWGLLRDGEDWVVEAGVEVARLRDVRGLHFLRTLLAVPGRELAALDLVAGGAGLLVPAPDPLLDAAARRAYQRRLTELEERLDAADRAGDVAGATEVTRERAALVTELRAATGTAGRPRRQSAEAERARVNATRAIGVVLRRLDAVVPLAAAHLRASVRTGGRFRYQPAPGGPRRWRV